MVLFNFSIVPSLIILLLHLYIFPELPCCRPCENTGGYLANISLPSTCEQTPKDCEKLGARCCRGPRVEGCSCPNGTFFDGKKCVNQTSECERPCVGSSTVTLSTSSVSSTSSIRCVMVNTIVMDCYATLVIILRSYCIHFETEFQSLLVSLTSVKPS